MSRPPRLLVIVSALYGLALAIIALWPTHIDSAFAVNNSFVGRWLVGHGLRPDQSYRLIEFASNVVMYAPLGVIVMVLAPMLRWWRVCALALVVSGSFELLQAVFRPGRTADVSDVVANTLGAAVGAACVVVVRVTRDRRGVAETS